ncbi:NAD-dependent epimerase/dehydratase family protein [Photobacterium japonica]|uniref:NAD-dependent epimerase/dehydratase family protein n=1 Tax=Photobacterium japonica TaxID=2910235 RepID=UPI003D105A69
MDIWNNTKVSICGCGWLGAPLAAQLVALGAEVWGSRQQKEDVEALAAMGVHGVKLQLPLDVASSSCLADFFTTDVLVINVPPGRQTGAVPAWQKNVGQLIAAARHYGTQRIIFISTTAVYGGITGTVVESTPVQPETASGHAHAQMEQHVLQQWGEDAVVLRLAGLIGPGRHPVRFLSGREGILQGGDRVNLIHQHDCIQAIKRIIQQWPGGQVLHLAAPEHPSRARYYCHMAAQAGLPLPQFIPETEEAVQARGCKVIDAQATCELLDLTLTHPDLMAYMPEI